MTSIYLVFNNLAKKKSPNLATYRQIFKGLTSPLLHETTLSAYIRPVSRLHTKSLQLPSTRDHVNSLHKTRVSPSNHLHSNYNFSYNGGNCTGLPLSRMASRTPLCITPEGVAISTKLILPQYCTVHQQL